jgi:hypothetical protein
VNKLNLTLSYDDLYFLPVKKENINAGWLDWMNNHEITKYLASESKRYMVKDLQEYLDYEDSLVFLACYRKLDNIYLGNLRIYQLKPGILSFGRLIGDKSFHGLGYGTKLNKVAIDLCFKWFRAEWVVVGNHKANKASSVSKIKTGFAIADNHLLGKLGLNIENAVYMNKESYLKV